MLHTLGQLVGRDSGRSEEAEALLRKSFEIGETLGNRNHQAQVLHTLGQLVGRDSGRSEEAEALLRKSFEIGETLENRNHQAQVLHTLGQLVGRDSGRSEEAEALLRKSLDLEEERGNTFGEAQVLHTLGQLVGRNSGRSEEAEALLRKSLEIGETLGNRNHQAQVLYSMARVVGVLPSTAEELLRESLRLNRETRNKSGERIVRAELSARPPRLAAVDAVDARAGNSKASVSALLRLPTKSDSAACSRRIIGTASATIVNNAPVLCHKAPPRPDGPRDRIRTDSPAWCWGKRVAGAAIAFARTSPVRVRRTAPSARSYSRRAIVPTGRAPAMPMPRPQSSRRGGWTAGSARRCTSRAARGRRHPPRYRFHAAWADASRPERSSRVGRPRDRNARNAIAPQR